MELTVTKTIEEKIHIDLSTPLYRKYDNGGIYYRISSHEKKGVEILNVVNHLSLAASISVMYQANDLIEMVKCHGKFSEINAEQFQDEVFLAMKLMKIGPM